MQFNIPLYEYKNMYTFGMHKYKNKNIHKTSLLPQTVN